jgi:hypothetical protein
VAEYDLKAGDVLHIPALFGHEGITTRLSVSLSIAWKGLSPYKLLGMCKLTSREVWRACSTHAPLLLDLLPDAAPDSGEVAAFLADEALARLRAAGLSIDEASFRTGLRMIIRGGTGLSCDAGDILVRRQGESIG